MEIPEPEVVRARRAFPDAQALMAGAPALFDANYYTLGWRGSEISLLLGSFCVVRADGPLQNLVGDHLRFRYGLAETVQAYCVGSDDIATDICVTRRVFAAIELLSVESIDVLVEVIT